MCQACKDWHDLVNITWDIHQYFEQYAWTSIQMNSYQDTCAWMYFLKKNRTYKIILTLSLFLSPRLNIDIQRPIWYEVHACVNANIYKTKWLTLSILLPLKSLLQCQFWGGMSLFYALMYFNRKKKKKIEKKHINSDNIEPKGDEAMKILTDF